MHEKQSDYVFLRILSLLILVSENQPYHHFSNIHTVISREKNPAILIHLLKAREVSQLSYILPL